MDTSTPQTKQALTGFGALIDQTIKFYQTNWKTFAPVLIIAAIPSLLIAILRMSQGGTYNTNSSWMTSGGTTAGAVGGVILLLSIVHFVLQLWSSTTVLYILKKIVQGQPAGDIQADFKESLPFIIPLFLTELITGIIVVVGFILLIIPGLIFLTWGFAVAYVFMFEQVSYYAAFQRSKALVSGYWWPVFVRLVLLGFIVAVIGIVLGLIPFIGQLLTPLIVTPVGLYYGYNVYSNLKQIKEGTPASV